MCYQRKLKYSLTLYFCCVYALSGLACYVLYYTYQQYINGNTVLQCPNSAVRPSVVRKLRVIGNCCMDPDQSLWETPSPPYHQTFFFFFKMFKFSIFRILFSLSLTWDPMGAKMSKCHSSSIFHLI